MSQWDIWKSGFSLLDTRRIRIFHTHGRALPFPKAKSLFIGNKADGTAVQMVSHVPSKGMIWTKWELLSAGGSCKAWSVWVCLSKISFGFPLSSGVRKVQARDHWHTCTSEFTWVCFPWNGHVIDMFTYSQYLLPFLSVQRLHRNPNFWNWLHDLQCIILGGVNGNCERL